MSTKMKGLFKGFKYITQIFDEKEEEMQIGLPTDVKHLAHIGVEGQSATTPSWMNDFNNDTNSTVAASGEDANGISAGIQNKLEVDVDESKKSRRKSSSKQSSSESPKEKPSDAPKPRRHHRSSDRDSQDSSSSGKGRRTKRHSNCGNESQDLPSVPKHSNRRKSKGSSNDGSSRSRSSSNGQDSLSDDQFPFSEFGSAGGHRTISHVSKENEHIAMAISA